MSRDTPRECKWRALCKCHRWIRCSNPLWEGLKNNKHQHIWVCGAHTFSKSRNILKPDLVTATIFSKLAKPNKVKNKKVVSPTIKR